MGRISRSLGVRGIPAGSEIEAVRTALDAAGGCGGRIHLTHLSLPESVELVVEAVGRGVRATCDVTPHHLALDETEVLTGGAMAKMNPPLRSPGSRARLVELVASGFVHAVATDHAPHSSRFKSMGLEDSAFGVTGLETALPVTIDVLCGEGGMSPSAVISLMSLGPSRVLGLECPSISAGRPFEAVLYDPGESWLPSSAGRFSLSGNTPFMDREMRGRVRAVWKGGLVYRDGVFVRNP